VQRRALRGVVGEDLSLPVLVTKMAGSEEAWRAVVTFCEEVMLRKETAERIRRQEIALPAPVGGGTAATAASGTKEEEPENGGGAPAPPILFGSSSQEEPKSEGAREEGCIPPYTGELRHGEAR